MNGFDDDGNRIGADAAERLRDRGFAIALAAPLLAATWSAPSWLPAEAPAVLFGAAVALLALSVARPAWLAPVARPVWAVLGKAGLAALFFGVVTPLAIARRLLGRDDAFRHPAPGAATYWRARATSGDPRSAFRQPF